MNKGSSFGINIRFVTMAVPKGLKDSVRGFNPGFGIKKNCALKAAPDRPAIGRTPMPTPDARPSDATREALRSRPRRRPRPRIRPRGVLEYWSVGVLRQFGIAPRVRGVGSAFRAHSIQTANPGLKPWAESLSPFGTKHNRPHGTESRSTFQTFVNSVSLADVASRVYHITGVNGAKW
jgi:hypothetical protein